MTDGECIGTGMATVEMLDDIHGLIEQAHTDHPGIAADELIQFETAVSEIITNVIKYGKPPGRVRCEFRLTVQPGRIAATLSDTGAVFEPQLSAAMPDPQDLDENGRGLILAQAMLHELDYRREGDQNVWTMARNLPDAG